jgi:iron complex transport system ATP-binding protein
MASAITITDLHLTRGATPILRGIDIDIPAGSYTAILGPNGCGKTTLTRTLTGAMFFTHGSVQVLGETIGEADIRALRRRISVVNPTASTAEAHVTGSVVDAELSALDATLTGFFGTIGLYDKPTDDQRERAEHMLREVGLGHRVHHRFSLLSTGEQRRCLIARSLVHRPELLILDEPTAGLDISGREHVLATIEAILAAQEKSPASEPRMTVLMITHHVEELSPRCAQVMLMREGQFTRVGKPNDVITPESLSETFGCKVFVRKSNGRWWLEVLPEAWIDLVKPA